jgi:hypothetical protein
MTFLVTKSAVSDFYIISRTVDTTPRPPPSLISSSEDELDATSCLSYLHASSSATSKRRRSPDDEPIFFDRLKQGVKGKAEPIVFGDVDTLEEMMKGTNTACVMKREEEEEPAPRKRRNAISAFLDGLF